MPPFSKSKFFQQGVDCSIFMVGYKKTKNGDKDRSKQAVIVLDTPVFGQVLKRCMFKRDQPVRYNIRLKGKSHVKEIAGYR